MLIHDASDISGGIRSRETLAARLDLPMNEEGCGELLRNATEPLELLRAFHLTFVCVGLVTCASACIFWQLEPDVSTAARHEEAVEIEVG